MKDRVVVNGIEIGPSTDVRALLRTQFTDGSLLAGRYDEDGLPGVRALFQAADGTALAPLLDTAVAELATDPDPKVRKGAVQTILHFAEQFNASNLLEIMDKNPDKFANGTEDTWSLLRAMAGSSDWSHSVRDRLRLAVRDERGAEVLAGVASKDQQWLIDHSQEVIQSDPTRAAIVLFRLRDPVARERLARSISKGSPGLRQILRDAVLKEVKDPSEASKLTDILS